MSAAEWVAIDSIQPWSGNPRRNDHAVADVAASIERFGFGAPMLARLEDRSVIAGHTRLKAAAKLGLAEVPVRFLDLDEGEARALAIADNRLGELADWDDEMLAEVLRDLDAQGADLDSLGWDPDELAELLGFAAVDGDDEDATPLPLPEVPHSVAGEVYELGSHRLACGDSTDAAAWAALLLSERLQAVWTDPPYGVSYVGKTADALTIENDRVSDQGLAELLRGSLGAAMEHSEPGAPYYVAAPAGPKGMPFAQVLHSLGLFRQRLIWVKDAFVLGHSDYHYRHEDIYYGFVPAKGRLGRGGKGWYGDNAQQSVFEVPRPKRSTEHPTMKPVALIQQQLENSSQHGWLVGDPFGGSGSTLIAAAASGRRARLLELDPRYCDVIRRRWTRWAAEHEHDPGPGALDG